MFQQLQQQQQQSRDRNKNMIANNQLQSTRHQIKSTVQSSRKSQQRSGKSDSGPSASMMTDEQRRMTFQDIDDGTQNFVDVILAGDNMEKVLRAMIAESRHTNDIGWLPSVRFDEDDIRLRRVSRIKSLVDQYLDEDAKQKKMVYITNMCVSRNNGHNHFCALWIDKTKRTVELWDSATSGTDRSQFTDLFTDGATFLLKDPTTSTQWANSIKRVTSTTDEYSFQHGGGFKGDYMSVLYQNVYCHTWTLYYLELRVFGLDSLKIGCARSSHPLIPLMIIKLYAQCVLAKLGQNPQDKKFAGLKYIWNKKDNFAVRLPTLNTSCSVLQHKKYACSPCAGKCCARRVFDTVIHSDVFTAPLKCRRIVFT